MTAQATVDSMPAFPALDLVGPALAEAVDRLDDHLRLVVGYHLGWWDATGEPTRGDGGKGLRPRLALLAAAAAGDEAAEAVPAAVAVELVHNFSLLHDDIMDGDIERRHRPTAWTVYGTGSAILAGDALLTLAGDVLLESGSATATWAQRCLSGATSRLIRGQSADLGFERRMDVSAAECLQMAADKTAALISCSCALGGILVEAPPDLVLELAKYGEALGLAFQVVDDLLGIWGCPAETGKPVLADLRVRKKSVPVVAALTSRTPAAAELRCLYDRPGPLDEDALRRAAELVELTGGRAQACAELDRQLQLARHHLERAGMVEAVRRHLDDVITMVGGRAP